METLFSPLKLAAILILATMEIAVAGPIPNYPQTNQANNPDLIILDSQTGGAYTTTIITASNLAKSSMFYSNGGAVGYSSFNSTQFNTNGGVVSVNSGVAVTNANLAAQTTASNITMNGAFIYTNSAAVSNSFRMITTGNNPPTTQMPMFGQSISGGNFNYLDLLNLGFAYDLTNNYADIVWGGFNSQNIQSGYPAYNQEFELGMSSVGGNWNYPFPFQSNYGVYDGAWNGRNSLVLECDGGNPFIIAGDPTEGGIIPQLILSRDYHHFLITDRKTGTTNLFDFNKSNGIFCVTSGGMVVTNTTNFLVLTTGISNAATPMFAEVIPNANQNNVDTLNIGFAYDLPGQYADIAFGGFNSQNIRSDYPAFNSEFQMGMSSTNGNWNGPFPAQSNWGVFDGAWNGKNCFVFNSGGGNPVIFSGDTASGEVPEMFLSRGYVHFFITDFVGGRTNFFDFNKSNGNFYVNNGLVSTENGVMYLSNSFTTNTIVQNGLTNGGTWVGMLSNKLVAVYMTNNILEISNLVNWP